MRLGVLDQSPIPAGATPADALVDSVELARVTESLGYERYWVAEHHTSRSFAGAAPEILIDRILQATTRIRVGSGGVMLMHYSPLKVAETFGMLAAFHPDRVDLGVGRAPGSDGLTAAALAYGSNIGIEYFPAKLADLAAFLHGRPAYTEAFANIRLTPLPDVPPELWVLGSSASGAQLAGHFGLPYCHAHFIAPDDAAASIALYRERFRPSVYCDAPRAALGVFVLTSEDPAHCERLVRCRDLWRLRFEGGRDPGPIPSIEEAATHAFTAHEQAVIEARRRHGFHGTPAQVRAQLERLAHDCAVEDLQVISITHAFEDRVQCYELLAREFGVSPSARAVSSAG